MTPTARTLEYLRRCGHAAAVVERWIPGANVRRDLFGCIDIVAVRPAEPGVLGVQATSLSNVSARLTKAKGRPELKTWLASGNRFVVHGWYKRAGRWDVKVIELRGEDLAPVVIQAPRKRARLARQAILFDELASGAS